MLKKELGVDADLQVGPSGEFFVQVDGETVIAKQGLSFPPESEIVSAVSKKLA